MNGYTRIEIHSGPDKYGRYFHTRFSMTDYKPGHPDGEHKLREIGQVFNAPLPTYCPHGYGECYDGCVYPGRCGRFRAALATKEYA